MIVAQHKVGAYAQRIISGGDKGGWRWDHQNATVHACCPGKTDSGQRRSPPCLDVAVQHYGDWSVPKWYPNKAMVIRYIMGW